MSFLFDQFKFPPEIAPEQVHLPGIYVDKIVVGEKFEKRIANLSVSGGGCFTRWQSYFSQVLSESKQPSKKKNADVRERIAARAALELEGVGFANLGGIVLIRLLFDLTFEKLEFRR